MKSVIINRWFLLLTLFLFSDCKKDTKTLNSSKLNSEVKSGPTPLCTTSIMNYRLAGSGLAGHINGPLSTARLQPLNMVQDASGNIYFTEYGVHSIRKITPLGFVLDFVGGATAGLVNGTGAAAKFNNPKGLALDNLGNLIVADRDNNAIRKVTPTGEVTTITGGIGAGYVDDLINKAKFNRPSAVAVDLVNNDIYVLDAGNERIRKVKQLSKVWTVVGGGTGGDGPALSTRLIAAQDISFNTAASDLVICGSNGAIRSFNPLTGLITTVVNIPQSLMGVCMDDARNIYFTTQTTATFPPYYIKQLNRSTGVITLLGGGTGAAGNINGSPADSRYNQPIGLWVSGDGSTVLVADFGNNQIRRIAISCL